MTHDPTRSPADRDPAAGLRSALSVADSSARLQAALTAGTRPDPAYPAELIARCAVEPDFYVRDMLTWAIIQHDHATVITQLLPELDSALPQARSQALHTLTKIGDPATWSAIRTAHLHDPDDNVARAAWRAAAGLVPDSQSEALADELATQLGRGERDVQLSLSRAFVELGAAAEPALHRAQRTGTAAAQVHAAATERLVQDPEEGFDAALWEARRLVALRAAPSAEG